LANLAGMGDVDPKSVEMRISGLALVPAIYDCAITNGGSDCVGAVAFSAGHLLEDLRNQDEDMEIESYHCTDSHEAQQRMHESKGAYS
jgi:hypothetical protein